MLFYAVFVLNNDELIGVCWAIALGGQGDAARIEPSLPPPDRVKNAEQAPVSTPLVVVMTLPGDAAELTADATVRDAFEDAFTTDMASVLGVSKNRLVVTGITAGSVVVQYTVAPADDGSQMSAMDLETAASVPITFSVIQACAALPISLTAIYASPVTATVSVALRRRPSPR